MSTRANIVVTDNHTTLWFYRHSDGYPEGAMPLLEKFLDAVKSGAIRDNTSQAAGWLVIFGAQEYADRKEFGSGKPDRSEWSLLQDHLPVRGMMSWNVGSIQPTSGQHGDIEYLYVINLKDKTIEIRDPNGSRAGLQNILNEAAARSVQLR